MFNIAILSRGAGLYSTQRLFQAARQRGFYVRIIDHQQCHLFIEEQQPQIWYDGERLTGVDAVIPRIGASVTDYGAAVIRHFELMGVYTATRSEALLMARDKLKCLQYLSAHGVPVPRTFIAGSPDAVPYLVEKLGGAPVVIKLLESTHGVGVILAESLQTAVSLAEVFARLEQPIILQEYIRESGGTDVRAFVVGRKVVASMLRVAAPGEFRSNLHRGATGHPTKLSPKEENLVLKATRLMGLQIAGVDLLRSARGPLVIEVNASPGLEGIETATGIDIAGAIIRNTYAGASRFRSKR
ncbi:MAG: putative alpha-L-glutamate ligase [Saprospiraceae bacterium]|nr:MAG: putative alpha-L-glutamate ligase [Saprospiraceae bacterium]